MTELEFYPLVSEAVQDRYARAVFEYRRAQEELLASWQALVAEKYARDEATNPPGPTEDMG